MALKEKKMEQKSKFLSLVLRHKPDMIGITLDANGWVLVDHLLEQAAKHGESISREELDAIVAQSDKKRFTLTTDGTRIRAAQGHSVSVNLALEPVEPPEHLFHGTATKTLAAIRDEGLKPGFRQQVHLSQDEKTAVKVGQRHGTPHVLRIAAKRMHDARYKFYQADNGVWLTDHVPAAYLSDS